MPVQIGDLTLYTVQDLADMLEVSASTIRKYLRDGALRGRKMGHTWYVSSENILLYFRSQGKPDPELPRPSADEQLAIMLDPVQVKALFAPEMPPPPPPKPEPIQAEEPEEFADWRAEVEWLRKKAEALKREAERIERLYAGPGDDTR